MIIIVIFELYIFIVYNSYSSSVQLLLFQCSEFIVVEFTIDKYQQKSVVH
jgi:hypothetical protein